MAVNIQYLRPFDRSMLEIDVTHLPTSGPDTRIRVNESVTWHGKYGIIWHVPKGFECDGASIPRWAWSIIGHPFYDESLPAAILHDFYCNKKTMPHKETHKMFHRVMIHCGVPKIRADIMYIAVRIGGPKWK